MFKYKDQDTGSMKYFYCKDPTYAILKDFMKYRKTKKNIKIKDVSNMKSFNSFFLRPRT